MRNNDAHGNGLYDGPDGNPGCDDDIWKANRFGTVNQPCVSGHG